MKKACLLLLLACLTSTANAQQDPKTSKEDKCSISGMVVTMAGSMPLRKAHLVLQSTEDKSRSVSTTTSADGHFALKGIEPGPYRFSVSRVGFVTEAYGQRQPNMPGAILTLRPRQNMEDLLFRLIPSGVISGKILDEDGEPLPSVSVQAMRQVYSEGKRSLSLAGRAETNDLGEYRLYGLSPGRYFVGAVYPRWNRFGDQEDAVSAESHAEGYAKMYYPGTADAAKAQSITIKPGEEVPSIEILMHQVSVHQVRGHVYNQITHKPGRGATLLLIPKKENGQWDFDNQTIVQKPDGSFEFPEVLPNSYVLVAYWFDEGKFYVNRQPVEVGNADVEGLAITITPGVNVSGRVVWDGKPSLEKDEFTVEARPVDFDFYRGQARVMHNNLFTLKDLGEGTYRTEVAGQSKDCYIKEVRYGESSALKDGFTVSSGPQSNLEILISSHGAQVKGTVLDENGLPSPGVSVVLVPDLSRRDQYGLYVNQSTDQYGHFEIRGITPGSYKLFSWEEVEQDAWQDSEFLKPFEGKGESITLNDDDRKEAKITAIRAKKTEDERP